MGRFYPSTNIFLTTQTSATDVNRPRAYLNWILFDEQFNFVSSSSNFEQVPVESTYGTTPNNQVYLHTRSNLPIDKNGYLYVYVSNETPNIDVFFDNLQVTHTRGAILEETHYYPFGLTMAGISSKAAGGIENKRKFNSGSELQSKEFTDGSGLELYATNFRSLDPQLGRWLQVDPKPNDSESPYSAMGNNPILFNDILGDTLDFPNATPEFIDMFYDAYASLDAHGVGDNIATLISLPDHIKMVERDGFGVTEYVPSTKTFYWNPHLGVTGKTGVTISPATGLDHDADHAVLALTNPKEFRKNIKPDKQFGLKEERRVITGREQKTALAMKEMKAGEVTRTSHNEMLVITSCPTCTNDALSEKTIREMNERKRKVTNTAAPTNHGSAGPDKEIFQF